MMKKKDFEKAMLWCSKYVGYNNAGRTTKAIVVFAELFYILEIAYLLLAGDKRIYEMLIVPGVSFAVVSFYRNFLSLPRPYEKYEFEPMAPRKKKPGRSFPSRHVFSCFMIAVMVSRVWLSLGIILLVGGCILAVLRVITGMHFIRDVVAGALMGLLFAALGIIIFI